MAGRRGGSEKSQRDLENVLRKVGGKGGGLGQRTELLCSTDPSSPLISSPNRSLLGFKKDCYPETVVTQVEKRKAQRERLLQDPLRAEDLPSVFWPPRRKWAIRLLQAALYHSGKSV